jgi:hypothetical protein
MTFFLDLKKFIEFSFSEQKKLFHIFLRKKNSCISFFILNLRFLDLQKYTIFSKMKTNSFKFFENKF